MILLIASLFFRFPRSLIYLTNVKLVAVYYHLYIGGSVLPLVAVYYPLYIGKLRTPLSRYHPPIMFNRVKLVEVPYYSVGTNLGQIKNSDFMVEKTAGSCRLQREHQD